MLNIFLYFYIKLMNIKNAHTINKIIIYFLEHTNVKKFWRY